MTSHRWLGLAVSAVAAASVISAGASALAASQPAHTNYHGPARTARAVTSPPGQTNDHRPARSAARAVTRPGGTAAGHASAAMVTHHYSLAASAFAPDGLHNTADDYFNQWDPTTLSNQDSGRCFNTGLSLPPSITLKSVKVYYTAGSTAMFFEINRQDLATHAGTEVVSFDTTAITTTPAYMSTTKTIPAADATVNMGTYAYSVGVCPNGNTTFSGLTITYTQPAG
jgi:hypothetical protein